MDDRSVLPQEHEPRVRVLLADDDAATRSMLAACARDTVDGIVVLEAKDGAGAIQLGLQQHPQIALLDIAMPLLGGIEAAITLRELQPRMRLALQATDPHRHRGRSRAYRLPLFDKRELAGALNWLEMQVRSCADAERRSKPPERRSLECSACGYGISCARPPERCPMCQADNGWIDAPWRPFRHEVEAAV